MKPTINTDALLDEAENMQLAMEAVTRFLNDAKTFEQARDPDTGVALLKVEDEQLSPQSLDYIASIVTAYCMPCWWDVASESGVVLETSGGGTATAVTQARQFHFSPPKEA